MLFIILKYVVFIIFLSSAFIKNIGIIKSKKLIKSEYAKKFDVYLLHIFKHNTLDKKCIIIIKSICIVVLFVNKCFCGNSECNFWVMVTGFCKELQISFSVFLLFLQCSHHSDLQGTSRYHLQYHGMHKAFLQKQVLLHRLHLPPEY